MYNTKLKLSTLCLAMIVSLSGCYHSISQIDTSKAEPSCARQCSLAYSQCVSGPFVAEPSMRACKESFSVCISACPPK